MKFLRASVLAATVLSVTAVLGQAPAPALRILDPENGAYVAGEILVRAALEPPGQPVDRLAFFVDGRLVCSVEQPPFECAWNGGTAVQAHLFRVVAYLPGGARLVRIARTKGVDYTEASGADAVHVTVTVLDNNQFVRWLPREAFRVFEDDVPQPIDYFAAETSPLELVIGVDVSASMVGAIDQVKENVKTFVSALRPADRVTLALFNENFFVLTRPSVDLAGRLKALDHLAPWGSTSLHEALVRSFDLLGRQARRRGLVIFTDGDDTSSRIPREAVERRSETSDAVVYLIGQGRAVGSASLKDLCGRLATTSGGRAFFPRQIEELRGAFDAILEEMSNQYLLSYAPPSPTRDATFHRIRVEVAGGYQVRARQGYRLAAR
jgi:Ca-activated chloride channel family protein